MYMCSAFRAGLRQLSPDHLRTIVHVRKPMDVEELADSEATSGYYLVHCWTTNRVGQSFSSVRLMTQGLSLPTDHRFS